MADAPVINPQAGPGAPGFVDPATHNAEVAAKLAAQDMSGRSTAPTDSKTLEDAGSALDKLAALVPDPNKPVEPTPEEKAAAETAAAESAKAAEVAAKEKAEREEAAKKADEYFKDSPTLPAGASPKSSEAFATIKVKAAQELSARDAKIEELSKKLEEVVKAGPGPEQLAKEKELEELRQWRAKLDVDFDPKFKQYDEKVSQAHEFVYAQLRKSPAINDKIIEEIKKYGGPEHVNLSKIFEAVKDPVIQRMVEAKVGEIELQKDEKERALKATKDNLQGYLRERQETFAKATTQHTEATQNELNRYLGALDWFKEKTADAKADAAAKAEAEEHNKFLTEMKGQLSYAMQDDSPQMRATLLTGMVQLFNIQRQHKTTVDKLTALEKEHTELKTKWEAAKKAGVSRLRESGASSTPSIPAAKPASLTAPAGDALDALARQITEQRAAKANAIA
jgi:hypothetical protein